MSLSLPALSAAVREIMAGHIGRENSLKLSALKSQVRLRLQGDMANMADSTFERALRKAIEDEPGVASGPTGYFYPRDLSEARHAVEYLEAYIRGLARRRRGIIEAFPDAAQMMLEMK